jgi:hypothetical protein
MVSENARENRPLTKENRSYRFIDPKHQPPTITRKAIRLPHTSPDSRLLHPVRAREELLPDTLLLR